MNWFLLSSSCIWITEKLRRKPHYRDDGSTSVKSPQNIIWSVAATSPLARVCGTLKWSGELSSVAGQSSGDPRHYFRCPSWLALTMYMCFCFFFCFARRAFPCLIYAYHKQHSNLSTFCLQAQVSGISLLETTHTCPKSIFTSQLFLLSVKCLTIWPPF